MNTTFHPGDHVRILCGSMFDGHQGEVVEYPTDAGHVRFTIDVFGRRVELALEPFQLQPILPDEIKSADVK
jgi:transcription antitermination factor NusG